MRDAVSSEGDEPAWRLDNERAALPLGGAIFDQWRAWKDHGVLPVPGGWRAQPLATLVRIQAIDLAFETFRYLQNEKADWSKLTATQAALIAWLNEEEH